jgi:hypothetical protein
MILLRNNAPDAFAGFTTRGFIRYGIELRALAEADMLPQHEAARPIAAAPMTATPKHIPALSERHMTSELVPTATLDDAKEVTP